MELSQEDMAKYQLLLQEEINFKEGNRRRATKYYNKHYKISEHNTEEEKEIIRKNKERRRIIDKEKYASNKDFYKAKQKQYRENKIKRELDQIINKDDISNAVL